MRINTAFSADSVPTFQAVFEILVKTVFILYILAFYHPWSFLRNSNLDVALCDEFLVLLNNKSSDPNKKSRVPTPHPKRVTGLFQAV